MLIPVKQLYPFRVVAPTTSIVTALEANLPVSPILHPRLFVKNTSAGDELRVVITHILDVGVSDDPLLTGAYSTVVFDGTVLPGHLIGHTFPTISLSNGGLTRHELTLEVNGASADVIAQVWLEGLFEESLTNSPAFEPIFV